MMFTATLWLKVKEFFAFVFRDLTVNPVAIQLERIEAENRMIAEFNRQQKNPLLFYNQPEQEE